MLEQTSMSKHDFEFWISLENTTKDETAHSLGGLSWHPDQPW